MIERIARKVPRGLVRVAPFGGFVFAFVGAGSAFVAVVLGSLMWVSISLGLFWLAALAWHVADIRR